MWLIVAIQQDVREPHMGRHGKSIAEQNSSPVQTEVATTRFRNNDRAKRSAGPEAISSKRTIRRSELFKLIPLAKSTIYRMEQCGEFPRRFFLTPRCVVWDLGEVEAWIEERRRASDAEQIETGPFPDVHRRKRNPVRQPIPD